ncbi:hypothetical protein IWQ49_005352, partial [Labrenzia sp. EL_126]|nr:hypothetical protein [Labrenzia sp. EL_126]
MIEASGRASEFCLFCFESFSLLRRAEIIPFLAGFRTGLQAGVFSFIAGVMPPMAMLGR